MTAVIDALSSTHGSGYTELPETTAMLAAGVLHSADRNTTPSLWSAWRRAAVILLGSRPPEKLDVPCSGCGARPGVECTMRRGSARYHAPRADRWIAAINDYRFVSYQLADAVYDVEVGDHRGARHCLDSARTNARRVEKLTAGSDIAYALPTPEQIAAHARQAGVVWGAVR